VKLNYWSGSWPLNIKSCPCDVHFLEYLIANRVADNIIFHFGTGAHHVLGKTNLITGQKNEIFALTASREEYQHYIDFVIENPDASRYYKVLFADIYTLTPRIIPGFDLVTLFHLCEFYDERRSAYAPLNDFTLVDLLLGKLNPGGKIFFYKGSSSFDKARLVISHFEHQGKLVKAEEYETLLVYRRRVY
jgi:hypothetical protein